MPSRVTSAVLAFASGWCRHRRLSPALVAAGGLSLIAVAAFSGDHNCNGCPTHGAAAKAAAVSATSAEVAPKPTETDAAAQCTATACAGCRREAEASGAAELPALTEAELIAASPVVAEVTQATVLSAAWPWVTPFGGVSLVAAHLMNRYSSCRCGRAAVHED